MAVKSSLDLLLEVLDLFEHFGQLAGLRYTQLNAEQGKMATNKALHLRQVALAEGCS